MSHSNPLPWILLGGGVLGIGGILLFSRRASAGVLPPGPLSPATKVKVDAKIAASNDPVFLKTLAQGLQASGQTSQALDALQKAANITGTVQQVPGAASLPPITIQPSPGFNSGPMTTSAGGGRYLVANGDIPGAIAKRFGVGLAALAKANGEKSSRIMQGAIRVNETLLLPAGALDSGPAKRASGSVS